MPYITSADIILRYDKRRVAELLSDNDASPVDASALSGSSALRAMCEDASSEIDAAVTVGNRYTELDLATLAADPHDGALLRRIACDLVWGYLLAFKGLGDADIKAMAPRYYEAKKILEAIENGNMVFGVDKARDAGLPKTVIPDPLLTNAPTTWNKLFGHFGTDPLNGCCC